VLSSAQHWEDLGDWCEAIERLRLDVSKQIYAFISSRDYTYPYSHCSQILHPNTISFSLCDHFDESSVLITLHEHVLMSSLTPCMVH
jgi:hypothetical protein